MSQQMVDDQRVSTSASVLSVGPAAADHRAEAVVSQLLATESPDVLARIAVRLDQARAVHPLDRVMRAWDLSHADVATMFSLSRQAIAKWLHVGVPAERATSVADMAAATDLLQHHLKSDRIPAVVRRPAPALGGRSLLDLAEAGEFTAVLAACRAMFQFGNVGS